MKGFVVLAVSLVLALAGCSSDEHPWVDDDVSFGADGLTIHGTYRHQQDAGPGPAALLISESGPTDRNGDNAVVGPIGNMRQLAEQLSDSGVASLRYDKVGTGKTGLGPYRAERCRQRRLHRRAPKQRFVSSPISPAPTRTASRCTASVRAPSTRCRWPSDTTPGAPKIHSLGLFQPLPGRYLDIITNRVRGRRQPATDAGDVAGRPSTKSGTQRHRARAAAGGAERHRQPGQREGRRRGRQDRSAGACRESARRHPGVADLLGHRQPGQCDAVRPLIDALKHTALTVVELKGVNHVLRDDPSDNIANLTKPGPLSPQLVSGSTCLSPSSPNLAP